MDEQIRSYLETLDAAPGDNDAFHALEQLFEKADRWDDLVKLYERRALYIADPVAVPALLAKAAELARKRLKNEARAEALYRQLVDADPASPGALQSLAEICAARGDFAGEAEARERLADRAQGAAAAPLYLELGKLWEEKLKRRDRAVLFYARASRIDPALQAARAGALEACLGLKRYGQAKKILDEARDRGADAKSLGAQYAQLGARLVDEPIEHELAIECVTDALTLDTAAPGANEALAKLQAAPKTWKEQARQLRAAAVDSRDRRGAAETYLKIAQLHAVYDPDGAAKVQENLDRVFLLSPGHADALDFLDRWHGQREDWRGLEQALTKVAATTRDRAAAVGLQLRLAQIHLVRFGDRALAEAALEKALELDPSCEAAALQAFELRVDDAQFAEALAVLEKHLSAAPPKAAHAALRVRAAEIVQKSGGDAKKAILHLEAALRVDPRCVPAAAAIAPLCEQLGEWKKLADALEVRLGAEPDAAERVRLLEQLADLHSEKLSNPREALRQLSRALMLDPKRAKTRKAMERAAAQGECFLDLARAFRSAAERAPDDKSKKQLLRRVAEIYDHDLEKPDEAVKVYRQLVALDDQGAAAALEACLAKSGQHQEIVADLKARLAAAKGKQRRELAAKLARTYLGMGDHAGAANAWREVLVADADDADALAGMAEALGQLGGPQSQQELEKVLARLAQKAAQPAERARFALQRAELLADGLAQPEQGAEALLALVAGGGPAPVIAQATAQLERLLAQGVMGTRIAQALAPLYAASGDVAKQVAMLEMLAAEQKEGREKARLLLDVAQLRDEKLADHRGALNAAAAALRAQPSHAEARRRCELLAAEVGAFGELFDLLAEVAKGLRGSPDQEKPLRLRAAQIAELELGRNDDAARELRRALELAPGDGEILAGLTRLAMAAERWEEACDLMMARAKNAQGGEKLALLAQLAELLMERLGSPAGAADVLAEALELAPPEQRTRLLARYAAALEGAGRDADLARALEELVQRTADPAEQARLTLKRARLLESKLGDKAGAVGQLEAVLSARPSDPEAIAGLEQILEGGEGKLALQAARALQPVYAKLKEHRKVVRTIEVEEQAAVEPAEKAKCFQRIAAVYERDLLQAPLAFAALARAAKVVPLDVAIRVELRRLADESDAADTYAEVYEELLAQVGGEPALPLWRELAEWCEKRLKAPSRATGAYAKMLEIDPDNLDALVALRKLHRSAERWSELYAILMKLADVVYEDEERLQLWREAAVTAETKLNLPEKAAAAWRRIAEKNDADVEAAAALDRLYEQLDRSDDLAWALARRRVQAAGSERERELAFRLAELKRTRLKDPSEAMVLYAQILRADPSHAGARAALDALCRAPGKLGGEALATLDGVLKAAGEHARRIEAREARLNEVDDPEERARIYADLRSIFERDVAQPAMAFVAACRAFQEGGPVGASVLDDLNRLAAATDGWEELADVYDEAAAASTGAESVELRRQSARVREQELKDPASATAGWKAVLEAQPDDTEALDALTRLYSGQQSARELAEVTKKRAALAQGPQKQKYLLTLGQLLAEGLGDNGGAIAAYREVIDLDAACVPAWEALDKLYSRERRGEELAPVLQRLAELVKEAAPSRRVELLLRRAALFEDFLKDTPRAIDAYAELLAENAQEPGAVAGLERMLARPESRTQAARLLEDVYRLAGDARRLVEVLELRLESADAAERAPLLAEVAALHERLGQKPQAFMAKLRHYRETLKDGLDDATVRGDLERLGAETQAFDELAAAFEDALEAGLEPQGALELRRRLANLYEQKLGQFDRAAKHLEDVASFHPDAQALEGLARIYRRQNALRELAGVYRRQAALAPNDDTRKDLFFEVATIMEEHLSDRDGAIDAYRQILAVDPEDPNALKLLGRLLGETERWDELAEVLQREVASAEQKEALAAEAIELRFRLGRIRQQRLSDAAGALDCFKGVLAKVPRHPASIAALEELARGSGPAASEAAAVLEPIYEQEGDYQKLVQAIEARIAHAPDSASRAALQRRVAEVYAGPLSSADMAFVAASRAVQEDPDDLAALELAVKMAEAAALPEELVELLTQNADKAHQGASRVEYRRRLARLFGSPAFAEPKRAVEEWTKLLDLAPSDAEALGSLTSLQRASGDGAALAGILKRRLAIEEDGERRAELLAELAQVQEEKLKDAPGATATLRRLLELVPNHRDALARLDRLCVKGERWVELAEVLAREAAAAVEAGDAAAAAQLKFRLAELKESRLLDREGALDLYEEVLAARADHPEAIARLEAALQKDPQHDRAATALEKAYQASGNWLAYAAVIESRAGAQPDPDERKRLFMALAEVREKRLQNPELAFIAACRAFRDDPSDAELRKMLERLAEQGETHEELAALYEEELDRLMPPAAVEVALKLGQLNEEKLEDAARAVQFYERARQLDAAGAPQALPALDRLYRQMERSAELADVLQAEADRETDPGEKVALLFRLGQLCEEKLAQPDRAAAAYEAIPLVGPAAPAHLPSLRALERLYEQAGRKDKLHENLTVQRAASTDAPTRERLAAKLAAVSGELGLVDEAIALWKEILAQKPRHDQAPQALEALYEQTERWQDLAELLRARLQASVDRREIARLNDKLGWLLGAKLGNAEQAIKSFKAVLDSDPKNRRALEALRDIYAANGATDDLVAVYRRLIPLQDDATGVKQVRLKLGEVLLAAGRKEEAVEQGKRAFDLEPHTAPELHTIEELFRACGAMGEVVRVSEARATLLATEGNVPDAVAAWFAVAELWREQKKRDGAAQALEKVMELEPANRAAYGGLRESYSASGNWRDFARVCDHFVQHVVDKAEKIALLKELAEVHEKRLGQKEMAFLALCRAFGEDSADAATAAQCQRLAGETEQWDALADVYEGAAEEAEGIDRAKLMVELGRIRDRHLDDADGAESAFRKALDADPASHDALDALTSLFSQRGRQRDLVIALEQKYEAAAGLDEKKATLVEIAKVYDQQLNDVPEAVSALKRVLELDGADPAAMDLLASIYRREKRWSDLAGVLARARDLAAGDEHRVRFQLQIAELYEGEIADDEAAVEAYRAVLELSDHDASALAGLERLYTKLDRFAELNRVYEKQVDNAEDSREKVKILGKSSGIWEEKLHNNAKAIEANEHMLQLDGANLQAVKTLERLYKQEGFWEKLISVTQHHSTLTGDKRELVQLNVAIGDVWWKELQRVDRAEAVYNHALEIEPDSREAIGALGKLYERSGNWNLALEMLKREARLAGAGTDAVDLYFRMGKINEDMLLDAAAAKTCYTRALDLDAGYLPAIRALKLLHELEKDRDAFLESLVAEAKYTEDIGEKTRLLYEVGKFYQEERDDRDNAIRYYEEALKKTPDFLAAAKPLADIYVAQENWTRAETMLDVVVKKLAVEGEPKDLCRQAYRLGYVAEKLEKRDKALECYRRAYELDATYLPALEGLGNLLVHNKAWDEALRIYQAILIHHRDGLTDLEVVEIYWQIGEIQAKVGQPDRAVKSFEKALEIDGNHEPSRKSLIAIYDAAGDHEAAVEQRQKLIPITDGDEKLKLLLQIGEICRDKLKDPYQAIDAYLGASKIAPGSLDVAEALLGLYRETRQGQKAADVLERMLKSPDVDTDPVRASKLYLALGEILRDDIRDEDAAVDAFNHALDKNPRLSPAFAAIEATLSAAKKWPQLEQAYVKMIQRLPKSQDVAQARLALWRTLGELYRRILKNPDGAIMAWEVVAKANPDDAEAQEVLADLLAAKPGAEEKAIGAFRAALRVTNNPQKATSALVGLHAARKEYDKAYSAAQVLTHLLGQATPEEQQVVSKLKRYARDSATRSMTDRLWTDHLYHEKVRGPLPEILALVATQAGSIFAQQFKDLGITPKKDEIDIASSMLFFVNMYKYVARTLGMGELKLYRVEGRQGGLSLVPTFPVSLVAGEEMFKDRPKKELWFSIAKALAFSRPELVMARLMPHDQLDVVFQAACSLGTSKFVVTGDPHLIEKMKRQLERALPESTRMPLKQLARQYVQAAQPGDLRAYMDGAELTSNRAGILLACDIDVAKKAILSEKAQVSKLRDQTKIRDLVLFCLSESYATLREQLGLSVVVKV